MIVYGMNKRYKINNKKKGRLMWGFKRYVRRCRRMMMRGWMIRKVVVKVRKGIGGKIMV